MSKLTDAIAEVNKTVGKGTLMPLNQHSAAEPCEVYSTRCKMIDDSTGIGGVPRGRIIEIYGPEAGGKTTLALQITAEAQAQGGTALFIDAEHALDPTYAQALGVNTDELLISQPDCGEDALTVADIMTQSGEVDIIVVDSVAALVPRKELEGDMGDAQMGAQGRLMSQAMRKLTGIAKKSNTTIIFINQIRDKLGVMFGNPETTTGGRALKFYASMRIDVRRTSAIKKGDAVVGQESRVKIVKNKLSAPHRQSEPALLYGKGFQNEE